MREGGILCFITSNKWMRTKYGEKLRKLLKQNTKVIEIVDFSGYSVFEQTVDTNIIIFQKAKPDKNHTLHFVNVKSDVDDVINYIRANKSKMPQEKLSNNAWTLADEKVLALKEKIEKIGKPLKDWNVKIYRGVLTGFNEAFIIDTETRNKILSNCKTEEERKRTAEIIKPVLRGRDIEKWGYKWAGWWIIVMTREININDFPAIKRHLEKYKSELLKRSGDQEWYQLQAAPSKEKLNYLIKLKIGYSDIGLKFTIVPPDIVGLNTVYFIIPKIEKLTRYLLGVLNSNIIAEYFKTIAAGLSNNTTRSFNIYMEQLPIPPVTPQNQHIVKQIEQLVDKILSLTQCNTGTPACEEASADMNVCATSDYQTNPQNQAQVKALEKQIDKLVYELYGLTDED